MSNLRETQHKRVVVLAASTIVFCLFSLWQLSSRIFEVGYTAGFEFTNGGNRGSIPLGRTTIFLCRSKH